MSEAVRTPEPAPLITVEDAAKMMHCSISLVYKLARGGALTHVRIGAAYRFTADDITAYIASRRVEATG